MPEIYDAPATLGGRRQGDDIRQSIDDERRVSVALIDVCRSQTPQLPTGPGVADALARAARYHRIAPLAFSTLRGTRPDLAQQLRPDRDAAFTQHTRVLSALSEIEAALGDLEWLTFKGPVLSELAHPLPGLRSYKDLDVLVHPRDLREAYARLEAVGWNVIDSNATLDRPELPGEVRIASRRRILVDLHWSMVVNNPGRLRFPVPTAELLHRRWREPTGLAPLWTLDSADSLVHVCLHAALSGATRLLHLIDADQLARQTENWDLVAQRAREWQSGAQTAVVLYRAQRLMDTPLPTDLYRVLGLTKGLRTLLSAVDQRWPTETLRQDESFPRLVARAARSSARGTLAWTLHNAALGVVNRLRPTRTPQPRQPADRSKVDQYLTAVEGSAGCRDTGTP